MEINSNKDLFDLTKHSRRDVWLRRQEQAKSKKDIKVMSTIDDMPVTKDVVRKDAPTTVKRTMRRCGSCGKSRAKKV